MINHQPINLKRIKLNNLKAVPPSEERKEDDNSNNSHVTPEYEETYFSFI